MSEKDNGGAAFPTYWENAGNRFGMTMRDYFAGLAMQSYLSWDDADSWSEDDHARAAYKMADAMLKARGK